MESTARPTSDWVSPAAAAAAHSLLGERGAAWLGRVDRLVTAACARHELTPTGRLDGGALSAVVAATGVDGGDYIVKVPFPSSYHRHAVGALTRWNDTRPHSAAEIVAVDDDTVVMVRITPGTTARPATGDTPLDDELDHIGDLLATIAATRPAEGTTTLLSWLAAAGGYTADRLRAAATDPGVEVDLDATVELFDDVHSRLLSQLAGLEPTSWRLLHGDLWRNNVCVDGDGRWVLIDPLAVAGPPVFDAAFWSVCAEWGRRSIERLDALRSLLGDDDPAAGDMAIWVAANRIGVAHHHSFNPDTRIPTLVAAIDAFTQAA